MSVPIEKIEVKEVYDVFTKDLSSLIIEVDRKILRLILDDYWKGYDDSFKVDLNKGRYYLHLINTNLHGYWTEIPDDTIFYILRTYYTLMYPHSEEKIIKRKNKFIFLIKGIVKDESGDENGTFQKEA